MGYAVTLYERGDLGGMMRFGIPDYRLPREILKREIQWIVDARVDVRHRMALGRDVSIEQLRDENDAVLFGDGLLEVLAHENHGRGPPGVVGGIDFLYKVNNDLPTGIGKRVAVIGGGNTAMDACRCSPQAWGGSGDHRLPAQPEEMPAQDIEIQEAMEEGVEFLS